MKNLFTKVLALMAMGIIMATPAFSQGLGGHSHTNTEEDPLYGKDWEIFHFPNFDDEGNHDGTFREVSYYNGGNFDNIKVNKLLGDHWMGRSINELEEGTEVYLCNMKTHQYLQIGDYWGENSMTNHSGVPYKFESGVPQRRVQAWEFFLNDENGYWLKAKLDGSKKVDRAVGRMAVSDGKNGHFEYNKFLALRAKDEYDDGKKLNDAGTGMVAGDRIATGESEKHPGAFLLHLKEVKKGGKTCYIIYTHRQTKTDGINGYTEFGDRESYLLVRSQDKQSSGYHTVRFKKFAGAMYGKYNKYTTLTLSDKSDLSGVTYTNYIGNQNVHKYGTYANAQGGNTYTTNVTSGMAGFTVTADADIIQAAKYGDNYGHTMQFKLTDQTLHTVTLTAPAGYVIAGYFMEDALTTTNNDPCYVTPAGGSQIEVGAGANSPGTKTIVSPSGLMEASTTFTIQARDAEGSNICFPKFYVYLQKLEAPIDVILGDRSNTVADNDKTTRATNAHKYGTYNNADGGNTYTTNSTSGMQGVTLVADGNYMNAAYYSGEKYKHTMRFHPGNEDEHTITISAPAGYYITSYNIEAITNVAQCPYIVNGTEVTSELETFSESNLYQQTVTFTIQKQKDGKDGGLCFPIIKVTLAKPDETLIASTYGNNKDNSVGDEKEYYDDGRNYVSLEEGLAEAKDDDANLWRIVTAEERNRYRLVASEDQPVDMTQRLKNPKFYTAYTYTRSVNQYPTDANFTWDETKQHYNHTNGERDFGWQWFDDDRMPHKSYHHIHPWDQAYVTNTTKNPGYFNPETPIDGKPRQRELHKVGTGVYYRFHTANMDASNQGDRWQDEFSVTWGQDANYVGSIWKGSSNLVQTIGTGTPTDPKLLEGLYLVRVKGFYAPHDMMKYHKSGNEYKRWDKSFQNEMSATSEMNTGYDWYKEAVVTTDGPDKGKWRRSYDSFLFAWTNPDYKDAENPGEPKEVRRMLPSIYEGAINFDEIGDQKKNTLSKEAYMLSTDFEYTQLGNNKNNAAYQFAIDNMKDETNFAVYGGAHFKAGRYDGWNYDTGNWSVPKTLIGAGRWFNVIDDMDPNESTSYANARSYLISLPVYVGKDGLLTIGVDHTFNPTDVTYTGTHDGEEYSMTIPASRPDEWVCFDDFEVIYLGKQEPDEFVLDEMNNRYGIGAPEDPDFYEYDNNTGDLKKHDSNNQDVPAKIESSPGSGKFVDNPAYANAIPTPLNTAQVQNQNNTQWIDLFDPQDIATTTDFTTVKKLIVRRTLTKDGWGSIVFPMSLTGEQIRKGFGENAQVAYLTGITDFRNRRNTIQYELVDLNASGKVIQAGMPYVIKPSIDPMVAKDRYYERSKYTIAYSSKAGGVANRYLKDPDRNKEVERKIYGPLYIIEDVEIKVSEVFPEISYLSATEAEGDGSIWPSIGGDDANRSERFGKRQVPDNSTLWEIQYKPNSPYFKLVETAHYEGGGKIPAYSYFHTNGKMYYTTTELQTTKGLYSYLQLLDTSQAGEPAYSKGFLGGEDFFVPVVRDIDGIKEVLDDAPDFEGNKSMDIYDLQGRKVKTPKPGSIYIMNGVKVLFK